MGDGYYYQNGVTYYLASSDYNDGVYFPGPLASAVNIYITSSLPELGSSGIREYSSMSSQVPTTSEAWISDIAFESSYPYSLHPTETNGDINVGDYYWYDSEVDIARAGGCYLDDNYGGPFAFVVRHDLSVYHEWLGSSGIRSIRKV